MFTGRHPVYTILDSLYTNIPSRQYTRTNAGGRGAFTPMLGSKRYHEMTKSRQSDIEKFKAKSRDEQIQEILTEKQIRKIKEKHKKDN